MTSPSCSFSALLDSTIACGLGSDYPGQVDVESLRNCTRDRATLKAGIRKPESGIQNPESGIENDDRKIHLSNL